MTNELKVIGWKQNGHDIDAPEGIHVEDYFLSDGTYLGPDEDGIEPVFEEAQSHA